MYTITVSLRNHTKSVQYAGSNPRSVHEFAKRVLVEGVTETRGMHTFIYPPNAIDYVTIEPALPNGYELDEFALNRNISLVK